MCDCVYQGPRMFMTLCLPRNERALAVVEIIAELVAAKHEFLTYFAPLLRQLRGIYAHCFGDLARAFIVAASVSCVI